MLDQIKGQYKTGKVAIVKTNGDMNELCSSDCPLYRKGKAGFTWGPDSGRQGNRLAYILLEYYKDREFAVGHYRQFRTLVLDQLSPRDFSMPASRIFSWILEKDIT